MEKRNDGGLTVQLFNAIAVFIGINTLAFGQLSELPMLERSYVGDYLASIPDPERPSSLLRFALNDRVSKEIGLSKEARGSIEKLLANNGGSLVAPSITVPLNISGKVTSLAEVQKSIDFDLVNLATAANANECFAACDEICKGIQTERLKQIVYQLEIERVGLAEAISDGFLGKRIGIEDYQRPALRLLGESIVRNEEIAMKRQMSSIASELSKILSFDQIALFKKLFGEPFIFQDDFYSLSYCKKTPDPDSLAASIALIPNPSIVKELGIDKNEIAAITSAFRIFRSAFDVKAVVAKYDEIKQEDLIDAREKVLLALVEDTLDPNQRDRLKQLVFHVELARNGICYSLTEGYLSKKLAITEQQKKDFVSCMADFEKELKSKARNIREESEAKIFKELSFLQRTEAMRALGKPFSFRE